MTKRLSFAVVGLLLLGCIAGCGDSSAGGATESGPVKSSGGTNEPPPAAQAAMQRSAAENQARADAQGRAMSQNPPAAAPK